MSLTAKPRPQLAQTSVTDENNIKTAFLENSVTERQGI